MRRLPAAGTLSALDACMVLGCRCEEALTRSRGKMLLDRSAVRHTIRRRGRVRSAHAEARRWWTGRCPRFLSRICTRGENSAQGPGRSGCQPTRRPASDSVRLRCVLEVPSRAGCLASTCPVRRPGNISPRERPRDGPRVSEKYTISRKFMQMGRYGQILLRFFATALCDQDAWFKRNSSGDPYSAGKGGRARRAGGKSVGRASKRGQDLVLLPLGQPRLHANWRREPLGRRQFRRR